MLQLSGTAWISFGVWMVIGIAVYFLYSRKHSALNNSKEEDDAANLVEKSILILLEWILILKIYIILNLL